MYMHFCFCCLLLEILHSTSKSVRTMTGIHGIIPMAEAWPRLDCCLQVVKFNLTKHWINKYRTLKRKLQAYSKGQNSLYAELNVKQSNLVKFFVQSALKFKRIAFSLMKDGTTLSSWWLCFYYEKTMIVIKPGPRTPMHAHAQALKNNRKRKFRW